MSLTNVSKYICRVTEFFNWGVEKSDVPIEKNPFKGVAPSKKAVKRSAVKRMPFTNADLAALFSSQEFAERRFENSYVYWAMPLALCTGARLNELAQLHLSDFVVLDGIHCLQIADTETDQRLKTENAKRLVPIHDFLIELGLLRHVERLRALGSIRLFPELTLRRDGYGHAISNWFQRYRKKCGITIKQEKVFHSFRHRFISDLLNAETEEASVAQIVGHEADMITGRVYWNARDAAKRKPTIQRFELPDGVKALIPAIEKVTFVRRRGPKKKTSTRIMPSDKDASQR